MGLRDLQILFSELTLGNLDLAGLSEIKSPEHASRYGVSLTTHEVELLMSLDWHAAKIGLDAHRKVNDTLAKARYLRNPATGRLVKALFPYPFPDFAEELLMPNEDENRPDSNSIPIRGVDLPISYPPQKPAIDPAMYNAASTRCAPAIDPAMYNAASTRCAPAIDPAMYNAASTRCAPAIDPAMYNAASTRCAPAIDPAMYNAASTRCAPAIDPAMYNAASTRCAPAIDPAMYGTASTRCAPAIDPWVYQGGMQMQRDPNSNQAPMYTIQLRGAVLRGLDLSNQDLRGANLAGADLTEANLSCTDLRGANLDGAILTGARIDGVKWK